MATEEVVFDVHCPRCGDSRFIGPVTLAVTNKVPKALEGQEVPGEMVFIAAKHANCYKCLTCGVILTLDDLTRSFEKQIAGAGEAKEEEKSE